VKPGVLKSRLVYAAFGSQRQKIEAMVLQAFGVTIAKAAVLFTTLQGARRPARITATMIVLDVDWIQPEFSQQNVCAAHQETPQEIQSSKRDWQQSAMENERNEGINSQQYALPVQQMSAMVLVHLLVDTLQFLHWCIELLKQRRRALPLA